MASPPVIVKEIKQIKFGVLSAEDILKMSVCEVNNSKLSGPNSVYDERMGVSLDKGNPLCITCSLPKEKCTGHFGHIILNKPVVHPMFYKFVIGFLKCFCCSCHSFLLPKDYMAIYKIDKMRLEKRFEYVIKTIEKIDMCYVCSHIQPKITKTTDNVFVKTYKSKTSSKVSSVSLVMTTEEIKEIFDNISNEDISLFGFDPQFMHPKNFIITVLPVLPSCSRPFIVADGNIHDDDITIQICEIIKANNQLATETNELKQSKALQALRFRIHTMYDNSKGNATHTSSNRSIKGIKERLTNKDGLIRNNLCGKRCNQTARSVISPNPSLKLDELGVPIEIADNLTFPETVNRYNIDFLTKIVNEGGANTLITNDGRCINLSYALTKKGTELEDTDKVFRNGKEIKRRNNFTLQETDIIIRNNETIIPTLPQKKHYTLEIGNTVNSKLRNGMICLLNRQPTLHKGSMMAVRIKRIPNKTFQFNLSTCKSFNADFDGDEMNIHIPASQEAATELHELSSVRKNIITAHSGKPNIVIVQDALLGCYKMTKSKSHLSKQTFFQISAFLPSSLILSKIKTIRKILKKHNLPTKAFTGKGLFSLILPNNFFYNDNNIIISHGVLISGVLTKDHLGGSYNSFIAILHKEYPLDTVCDFIDNAQFLAINYLLYEGFSVGIKDCLAINKDKIEDNVERCLAEAHNIENITSNEYIREIKVNACLNKAKDIGMKIAKDSLLPNNNFISTVSAGSKGDYFNIAQLTGLLGQQNLHGKRIPKMLNQGKRTLPHYPLNKKLSPEQEYESRGFVKSSFIKGLSPREFYLHSVSSREGICDTSMNTSKSGYIERKIVKCLEDVQTKYDGSVRNYSGMIYQNMYGENGYDPGKMVKTENGMDCCNVKRIVEKLNNTIKI